MVIAGLGVDLANKTDVHDAGEFDYVIVGAGSAGCALASRLSEDRRRTVLLLEAGGKGRHPYIHLPIGYGKLFYDRRFNWAYTTEVDTGLNGRDMYWPRGKALGGSSAINAMVYVRGHPADYDAWGAVASGWSWSDIEPVFRKLEHWCGPPSEYRGVGGPLTITDVSSELHPLTLASMAAASEAGFPMNPDYNGPEMCGVGPYQITTKRGVRASTASAYLSGARKRPNLKILTRSLATKIQFEGRRAVGISFTRGRKKYLARCRSEIVVSAGALNTPQLLQLSGVGPGSVVKRAGGEVLLHAPQVGRNLADHLSMDLLFESRSASLNQVLRPFLGKLRSALEYAVHRSGPLALSLNQAGGFVRLDGGDGQPDLQLYISPLTYSRAPKGRRPLLSPDPVPAFRLGFGQCKPTSVGHVEIASTNPFDAPVFTSNYLSTEFDCRTMLAGFHLVRLIAGMPALAHEIVAERIPGATTRSDADILEHIREDSWTTFHQSGTCRMGRSIETSVVDAHLSVHGVGGLRVADASVFPEIPSGNTNAPAVMVGERASEIIIEDARG